MKKLTKLFISTLLAGMCCSCYAQDYEYYEWKNPPQSNEREIDVVNEEIYGCTYGVSLTDNRVITGEKKNLSEKQLYEELIKLVEKNYGEKRPNIQLRNFKSKMVERDVDPNLHVFDAAVMQRVYQCSASVVIIDPKGTIKLKLHKTITQALQDIKEGSRLALDQIRITNGDKDDFKDQIVEILLDEGYKVVAKDYLEKLYEEQQAQQSGIYNDRTTVQENNFSAVGYYINVKQTEAAIKVQVINVSTGEYEANVTVNL